MAELSFMESARDKVSRLGGNPFSEFVEEATSEMLLVQDHEKISQLVHFGDQADAIADLLNAVRRRIDSKNAKVQCFTVVVLDALIRNCGRPLHVELANQKALLRDLVLLAAKDATREAEFKAKELATTLIVNCAVWFAQHPEGKVRDVLCGLAGHLESAGGSIAGIAADRGFTVRLDTPAVASARGQGASINGGDEDHRRQQPQRVSRQPATRTRQTAPQGGQAQPTRMRQQHVVDAIPVQCPPEEILNGMMEAVLLLVECLNSTVPEEVPRNETLNSIVVQIRRDHELVSALVAVATANHIEIANVDTLRSVADSQVEVLERHTEAILQQAPATQGGMATMDADEAAAIEASLADMRRAAAPPQDQEGRVAVGCTPLISLGTYRERLMRYYEFYNPGRLSDVDSVLAKFEGREEQMIRQLQAKYGPEPTPQQIPTTATVAAPTVSAPPYEPPVAPAPAPPTIDELFASASGPSDAQATAVTSATPANPVETSAPVAGMTAPPAIRRGAFDVDEPGSSPPCFPPMTQNMKPAEGNGTDVAVDAGAGVSVSAEPTAAEGQRASSMPRGDDDFDAFLNARLTR